ncbi:Hypothetical predicted protein, partial [Pelobates cultripes]
EVDTEALTKAGQVPGPTALEKGKPTHDRRMDTQSRRHQDSRGKNSRFPREKRQTCGKVDTLDTTQHLSGDGR